MEEYTNKVEETSSKLDDAVKLLIEVEQMDDSSLYAKVISKIKRKKQQKRVVWTVAAVLFPFFIYLGTTFIWNNPKIKINEPVSLILEDGSSIKLDTARIVQTNNTIFRNANKVLRIDYSFINSPTTTPSILTLNVPRGSQYCIELTDGSRVWLNAASRLKFPEVFMKDERRVYLEGEAYFEVEHQVDRPFIVETAFETISVLGTSFNVNTYLDNSHIFTTLVDGCIKIEGNGAPDEVTLLPGQQFVLSHLGEGKVQTADFSEALAWHNGDICMEDKTLDEITCYLARLYNVDFEFEDETLRKIRYKGSVGQAKEVEDVLRHISEASPVKFNLQTNSIRIIKK